MLPSLPAFVGSATLMVVLLWRKAPMDPAHRYSLDNWIREEYSRDIDESLLWVFAVAIAAASEIICYFYFKQRLSKTLQESPPTCFPYIECDDPSTEKCSSSGHLIIGTTREFLNLQLPQDTSDSYRIVKAGSFAHYLEGEEEKEGGGELNKTYQFMTKNIQVEWIHVIDTQIISGFIIDLGGGFLEEQLEVLTLALETSRRRLESLRESRLIFNLVFKFYNFKTCDNNDNQKQFESDDGFLIVNS